MTECFNVLSVGLHITSSNCKNKDTAKPYCLWRQGRIYSQYKVRGGDFSNIWWSSLITDPLQQERWSALHNTAVIKQWTTKWSYIVNVVFRIAKNYGK